MFTRSPQTSSASAPAAARASASAAPWMSETSLIRMPPHASGPLAYADGMANGASVIVVGGGVMGCSIAFHLAERGVDTLVLERGTVCSGMTARSGALVRMHYTNEPEARMALTGLGYFQDWKERVGGWCGFTVTGAAVLVGPGEGGRLRRNVAMLRRVGVDTE